MPSVSTFPCSMFAQVSWTTVVRHLQQRGHAMRPFPCTTVKRCPIRRPLLSISVNPGMQPQPEVHNGSEAVLYSGGCLLGDVITLTLMYYQKFGCTFMVLTRIYYLVYSQFRMNFSVKRKFKIPEI